MPNQRLLKRIGPDEVAAAGIEPVDPAVLPRATAIVERIRRGGEAALREHTERLDGLAPGAPLVLEPPRMAAALARLEPSVRGLLEAAAERIAAFARAQRACLLPLDLDLPWGRGGHEPVPVERAGCYAPAGRFPLPSSVLMTAVTARQAGVGEVWVASPNPTDLMLGAAAVAGADFFLAAGGAHAIAALAWGAGPVPPCDAVVGPGNAWVTAAKSLAAGRVAIDMLAGPSELVILADDSADPETAAADLLAQAEHDPQALPVLVTLSESLADRVDQALARQLETLPTAPVARPALARGFAVIVGNLEEGIAVCDRLAPEHLQVMLDDPGPAVAALRHYGALFIDSGSAEVFGDYGAGPNHVLPTGGTARSFGGLSVFTFLRVRTWLHCPPQGPGPGAVAETAALARLEGLEAHARAAERRS